MAVGARRDALRVTGRWAACVLLMGCPQLLEDDFIEAAPASGGTLNAGGSSAPGSAGTAAGYGGAGGRNSQGGNGSGPPDGGSSGTTSLAIRDAAAPDSGVVRPDLPDAALDAGPDASAVPTPPDAGDDEEPSGQDLTRLTEAVAHRYSFETTGTNIVDSVGSADGTFIGGSLGVSGAAQFSGGGEYIDLPGQLISVHASITVEAWLIWDAPNGGADTGWQRIFDFGISNAPAGQQGDGNVTHVFLSPRTSGTSGTLHLAYRGDGTGSITLNGAAPLPTGGLQHVAVTLDSATDEMHLYLNGAVAASRDFVHALSLVDDTNCWLGRSQQLADPSFQGRIFEFRIYNQALTPADIASSNQAGPDAQF